MINEQDIGLPPIKKERGDLADPKKVGRKDLMERVLARQKQEDTLFVLSTIQGRRFYWNLLKECGIFQSSFTGNNTTFFNEGQRNIGLKMLNDLNEVSPESYLKMIEEAKFEDKKNHG